MHPDSEVQSTIDLIRKIVEEVEELPFNYAKEKLKTLFDSIVTQYNGYPGMQSVMLSMAAGDIRHLERADSGEFFETWDSWVFNAELEPRQISRQEIRSACKRIFGNEDALLY
jgi:hypothetical protein